jgi:SAM-dependent methyltransferase
MQLSAIYERRFVENTGLNKRNQVWRTLCSSFFDALIGPNKDVLDLACGYGEFINNISAKTKTAIDLNPDAERHLASGVRFVHRSALEPTIGDATQDVVFASNFLEHLRDKDELVLLLAQVRRLLRNNGRFIVMGPNIKYAYKEYWDFFDHHLPLSHLSLAEGMEASGLRVARIIPRFLPLTMVGKMPTFDWMIRLYLKIPLAWAMLGKQFLIVAEKRD